MSTDAENETEYLLINRTASYFGNSPLFWQNDNSGYTPWVDDAKRFTLVEARRTIRSCRGTHEFDILELKIAYKHAKLTLDMQDLNRHVDFVV